MYNPASLIDEVRSHPCLYRIKHKLFKNKQYKNNLWNKLSTKFQVNAQCKWRSLRDRYVKEAKSGLTTWQHFFRLQFLSDSNGTMEDNVLPETETETPGPKIEYEIIEMGDNEIACNVRPMGEFKCGAIYLESRSFIFFCDLCETRFIDSSSYMNHVLVNHICNKDEIFEQNLEDNSMDSKSDSQLNAEFVFGLQKGQINECQEIVETNAILTETVESLNQMDSSHNKADDEVSSVTQHSDIFQTDQSESAVNDDGHPKNIDDRRLSKNSVVDDELLNLPNNTILIAKRLPVIKNNAGNCPCLFCLKSFPSIKKFERHYSTHHIHGKYHYCIYCKTDFDCYMTLKNHFKESHSSELISNNYLDEEYDIHSVNTNHSNIIIKPKSAKNAGGRYQCPLCPISLATNYGLGKHVRLKHIHNNLYYECSYCDKKFKQKLSLKYHTYYHTGERPYKCTICSSGFVNPKTLQFHIRVHLNDKRFKCDFCDKRFMQKNEKSSHERLVHNSTFKPYQCDTCGAVFGTRSKLTFHLKIHTSPKFECDICKKKCRRGIELKKHKLVHTGEKPYECNICLGRFRSCTHLRNHKKLHTGIKDNICLICGKGFYQKSGLYSHMKSFHREIPLKNQ